MLDKKPENYQNDYNPKEDINTCQTIKQKLKYFSKKQKCLTLTFILHQQPGKYLWKQGQQTHKHTLPKHLKLFIVTGREESTQAMEMCPSTLLWTMLPARLINTTRKHAHTHTHTQHRHAGSKRDIQTNIQTLMHAYKVTEGLSSRSFFYQLKMALHFKLLNDRDRNKRGNGIKGASVSILLKTFRNFKLGRYIIQLWLNVKRYC